MTRLSRRDLAFIATCLVLAAIAIAIIARSYHAAFPEASIDFRFDRKTSGAIAQRLVALQQVDVRGMKHAARFDSDQTAQIFLERSLGLENANRITRDRVHIWSWHHRWFRPLQEEEISVDVAPTGEIIAFTHKIPEERAIAGTLSAPPVDFLRRIGVNVGDLRLISTSERRLPRRLQRIYTWESVSIRPAGAPYRHTVVADGARITGYSQRLKVPDAWLRSYRELRSKNAAAGAVDAIFMFATGVAAAVVFIIRLRRGDLSIRFLLGIGIASVVLVGAVALNSIPGEIASYDTTTSYSAFIANLGFQVILQALGTAMLLMVICGAGEVLYRERFPRKLAMPRVFTHRAITSRRVFLSIILGYTLVPLFIAYQVVFYLAARKFGAWSPAEVPYDELLNSALPWAVVLFYGFYPALSEEFLSRAFSIPFLERIVRSRIFAIVLAGFIWGFAHSGYPNQPFFIRGLEVGIVGVVAGLLMQRVGLLPLVIWHFTVDAVYPATLLFNSGNAYYIASAAVASLIFAVPLVAAIVLYVRNRGFVPDEDLSNDTIPVTPPPLPVETETAVVFPPAMRVTKTRMLICIAAVVVAAIAIFYRPPAPEDAVDYRITKEQAKEIAARVVRAPHQHVIAGPAEGFRSWDPDSPREDGGSPGGFDSVAATYLVRSGVSIERLAGIFRTKIEAGTWSVRFFTPMEKEEYFVEVDPRTSRAVGYHKYLDERGAGASLSQAVAVDIARNAFPAYGLDVRGFDLQEALSFQQPNRRDWLFHFQEKTPLAAEAYRRVTVRVAGAEVTQFSKNVKVPESVVREADARTLFSVVFAILRIGGLIALLALAVTALVLASRGRGLPWRRPLRWTLILSLIPIASIAARTELSFFAYSTTMAWTTFCIRLVTQDIIELAQYAGVLFFALAGLEVTAPYARSILNREGRARFGRSAVIAALTAIAIVAAGSIVMRWIEIAWPSAASISFSVPEDVAIPLPALIDGTLSLFAAIVASGVIALLAASVRLKWLAPVVIIALFCISLDPFATSAQTPLMLIRAAAVAVIAWLIARYVLGANPLAWPLTVFVWQLLQTGAALLHNHRPDLIANGAALLALALFSIVWLALRRNVDAGITSVEITEVEVQPLSGVSRDRRAGGIHR